MTYENRFSFVMILLLIAALCLYPFIYEKEKKEIIAKLAPKVSYDTIPVVTISTYQATIQQTDSLPFEPASMINITEDMYWNDECEIGYCAISRDLNNFYFNMFDTLFVKINSVEIKLVVIDNLPMYRKEGEKSIPIYRSIDILSDNNFLIRTSIYFKK